MILRAPDRSRFGSTRLVAGAALLIALAVAVLATCSHQAEEQRATPGMFVTIRTSDHFTLAADLSLPRVRENRTWYGVWVMILGQGEPDHEPFVQGGLMRLEPDAARPAPVRLPESMQLPAGHELAPFLAFRRPGEGITYLQLPALTKSARHASHVFQIGRDGETLFVRMDGSVIFTKPAVEIFADGKRPRFFLAAEGFRFGDRAAGVIANVRTSFGKDAPLRSDEPSEYYASSGTCLRRRDRTFAAAGVYRSPGWGRTIDRATPLGTDLCPLS